MRPRWRWWLYCFALWAWFRFGWAWSLSLQGWCVQAFDMGDFDGAAAAEGEAPF